MEWKKKVDTNLGITIILVFAALFTIVDFYIVGSELDGYPFNELSNNVVDNSSVNDDTVVEDKEDADEVDIVRTIRFFEVFDESKNVYAISDFGKIVNLGAIGNFKLFEKDSILYYFTPEKELHKVDYSDIDNISDVGTGIIIDDYSNDYKVDWAIDSDYIYLLKNDKYIIINLDTKEKREGELFDLSDYFSRYYSHDVVFFDNYSQKLFYTSTSLLYTYSFRDNKSKLLEGGYVFSVSNYNNLIMLSRRNAETCLFSRKSLEKKFCVSNQEADPNTVSSYGVFPLEAQIYKDSIIVNDGKRLVMYTADDQNKIDIPGFTVDYHILDFSTIGDKILLKIGFNKYCYEGCSYNYRYYLLSLDGSMEELSQLYNINLYAVDNNK